MDTPIVGIDYGSKLAGTTVLAIAFEGKIRIEQSLKKKDADKFIVDTLSALPPGKVGLDAPLTLPGVYSNSEDYSDYFYRACDRELKAMSPMFLGGLTARAMRLTSQLKKLGWEVGEVYPAALAKALPLSAYAKTEASSIPEVHLELTSLLSPLGKLPELLNYHQVDGAVALLAAYRNATESGKSIGDAEGLIWI
ncbi:MAG: hypothetical protein AB8F78_11245 [Saprospiraceae bacterium]